MTRPRFRALPFVFLALAATLAAAQDAPPKTLRPLDADTRDYDQIDLSLDLALDMEKGTLDGTATHTIAALADLSQVRMHLEDMTVSSVTCDGAACKPTQADNLLTIDLDRPRKAGERFTLAIRYAGKPTSGLWFFRPTPEHPEVPLQVYSQGQGEENRHWIPCYDLPDDRLTTRMRVTVPAGLATLSNGAPQPTETLADGRVAHTWVLDRPHPSYLVTLVAGTFDDVKRDAAGVEQHDLVPPGWGKWAEEVFGRTPSMMGFFQEYTGQPYPWGRYSQVTVWDFMWGGMENTGATTLNMRALHEDGVRPDYAADGLVAHELAHMWFGDLLTNRTWNHNWLNEGFATYFTDLWVEHHEGREAFLAGCLGNREAYMNGTDLRAICAQARPAKRTDCGDVHVHPYVKGAAVLHMLRGVLGDDVFRKGIRRYVAQNKDKAVESDALRVAMEAEAGQELSWFFDQWVHGSGFPEITVASEWADAEKAVHVRLVQTQPVTPSVPLFRTPLDVEITWADGRVEKRRLEMFRASHDWTIPGPGAPTRITFDPDGWLLARVNEVKPRAAWEEQLASEPRIVPRLLAAEALGTMGSESVTALARAATRDLRQEVRAEASAALGKIGGEQAAGALVIACGDSDSRVRRAAVTALGEIPAAWSAEALRARLADPSVYVAADAAAALGKTKATGAFEALQQTLARDSHRDQVRQRVMDGLKDLGDARAVPVATGYLDYGWGKGIQHQLRKAALDAVVALAPDAPETKQQVLALLRDPYFRMKQWAAEHAVTMKIADAVPVLDDLAANGVGPGVRDRAKECAAKIRAQTAPGAAGAPSTENRAAASLELRAKVLRLRTELAALEKELDTLAGAGAK